MTEPVITYRTRVYYEDTDTAGVVYYANYLKWMERARTEWLHAQGFSLRTLEQEEGCALVVRHVEVSYRSPARLEDWVGVTCTLERAKFSTLKLKQTVINLDQSNRVLVEARVELATITSQTFQPRLLPVRLSNHLKALEH